MTRQSFNLHIKDEVLQRIYEADQAANRPVEDVLTESIEVMFGQMKNPISPEEPADLPEALCGQVKRD